MVEGRRWRPLWLVLVVVVLFALAWLPDGELPEQEREIKPSLVVLYAPQTDPVLTELAADIRGRMQQRHEWRLLDAPRVSSWQLQLEFEHQNGQIIVTGELNSPSLSAESTSQQRFQVDGAAAAAPNLAERTLRVTLDLVESGQQYL